MENIDKTSRDSIIKVVRTPLGFFTLIALIVEVALGTLAMKLSGESQLIALYGMIGTLLLLIVVVAVIGYKRPGSLTIAEVTEPHSDHSDTKMFLQTPNIIGLTSAYRKRSDAKEDIIKDVQASSICCRIYVGVYFSELMKTSIDDPFIIALNKAVERARRNNQKYVISYSSLAPELEEPDNEKINLTILQCWARREGEKSIQFLRDQIKLGTKEFSKIIENVGSEPGGNIIGRRMYFKNYLISHALLIIDNRIAYVSLYDWVNPRGTDSLTLRFEGEPWATLFVNEANKLDKEYSFEAVKA